MSDVVTSDVSANDVDTSADIDPSTVSNPAPAVSVDTTPDPSHDPTASPGIFSEGLQFREGWFNDVEGIGEYRSMLAQYKDLPSLAKSLKDTKAALSTRDDSAIKIPGEEATPEEIAAYRSKLGVPDSADGYTFPEIEGLEEGIAPSEEALAELKQFSHENGFPADMLAKLYEYQVKKESGLVAQYTAEEQARAAEVKADLENTWGDQFSVKEREANAIGDRFGLTPEDLTNKPGYAKLAAEHADLLRKAGKEDSVIGSGETHGSLTPGSMADDILNNKNNPDNEAFHDSAHPNHRAAHQKYMNLMAQETGAGR